jgi:hypothetical protein
MSNFLNIFTFFVIAAVSVFVFFVSRPLIRKQIYDEYDNQIGSVNSIDSSEDEESIDSGFIDDVASNLKTKVKNLSKLENIFDESKIDENSILGAALKKKIEKNRDLK